MNKKQLIVTSVLVLSMLVLAVSQEFFTKNFERISTSDKVMNKFKEYKIDTNECFILLPSEWNVDEQDLQSSYISRELKFKSINDDITGIIQVINTKENVEVFAKRDLKNQSLKFSNLKISEITDQNKSGVLSEYTTSIKNGNNYINKCYYLLLNDNQIIKVLFNIKDSELTKSTDAILNEIISSLNNAN